MRVAAAVHAKWKSQRGEPLLSRSAQRITQRCLPLTGGNWRTVQIGLADVNEDYLAPDHDDWKAGLGWGAMGMIGMM